MYRATIVAKVLYLVLYSDLRNYTLKHGENIALSPLYREDDIMMTPNSDNKAGARAHRTFRNNEEYYEIRGQRCYYSANEYLPSALTLIVSGIVETRNSLVIRARLCENASSVPRSCSIKTVFGRESFH